MTSERERIERMVREGKIDADEGERLLAALEKVGPPDDDAAATPFDRAARVLAAADAQRPPGPLSRPRVWLGVGGAMLGAGAVFVVLTWVGIRSAVTGLSGGLGSVQGSDDLSQSLERTSSELAVAWDWALVGAPLLILGAICLLVALVLWLGRTVGREPADARAGPDR
ncbi:MAG: SHOCT-like domain-containing protein [Planctomycetota bacterium]|jgi:hypothetical protein